MIEIREGQLINAVGAIYVTVEGIKMESNFSQLKKACVSILVKPFSMITEVKLEHPQKAAVPIVFTLDLIRTEDILSLPKNAFSPIEVISVGI